MDTSTVYNSMHKEAGIIGSTWDYLKTALNPYAQAKRGLSYGWDALKSTHHNILHAPWILAGKESPRLAKHEQEIIDVLKKFWNGATTQNTAPSAAVPSEVKTASVMNLGVVYDAMSKRAGGSTTPAQPSGPAFTMPPPITAPGSTPIMQQSASQQKPPVTQQDTNQELIGLVEKAMDKFGPREEDVPPKGPAENVPPPVGEGVPGMDPKGMPLPGQMMNTASDYGTVYTSMKKRATFLFGPVE